MNSEISSIENAMEINKYNIQTGLLILIIFKNTNILQKKMFDITGLIGFLFI